MLICGIVPYRDEDNIPESSPEDGPEREYCKIHPKYSRRYRDKLSDCRNESSNKCRDGSFFLEKFLCLEIVRLIEKNILSIFVDKSLHHWSSKIATKHVVDN